MTREWFCGLQRGDLVTVDGNGHCVVEGVFYYVNDGMVKADLRLMSDPQEVIKAIPETEAHLLRPITPAKPIDNGTSLYPALMES